MKEIFAAGKNFSTIIKYKPRHFVLQEKFYLLSSQKWKNISKNLTVTKKIAYSHQMCTSKLSARLGSNIHGAARALFRGTFIAISGIYIKKKDLKSVTWPSVLRYTKVKRKVSLNEGEGVKPQNAWNRTENELK